ncbi:unnamed protein product, partial [Amoebophrya sp. A120]
QDHQRGIAPRGLDGKGGADPDFPFPAGLVMKEQAQASCACEPELASGGRATGLHHRQAGDHPSKEDAHVLSANEKEHSSVLQDDLSRSQEADHPTLLKLQGRGEIANIAVQQQHKHGTKANGHKEEREQHEQAVEKKKPWWHVSREELEKKLELLHHHRHPDGGQPQVYQLLQHHVTLAASTAGAPASQPDVTYFLHRILHSQESSKTGSGNNPCGNYFQKNTTGCSNPLTQTGSSPSVSSSLKLIELESSPENRQLLYFRGQVESWLAQVQNYQTGSCNFAPLVAGGGGASAFSFSSRNINGASSRSKIKTK